MERHGIRFAMLLFFHPHTMEKFTSDMIDVLAGGSLLFFFLICP